MPTTGFNGLIAQMQGRYGTPQKDAEAALYFASDHSSFYTGSGLILGGLDASLI
jgi:hypothetical protein